MQSFRVNGYDMAYLEVGSGHPLVCVHGTLGDFRTWYSVLGPLSQSHRVISVSLRHFFPEHWDAVGDDYKMAQHVADVIAFIEQVEPAPVDLMGHSRGGHIAFRVAQARPDLLRKLVLAEPGGDLDASLPVPEALDKLATSGVRLDTCRVRAFPFGDEVASFIADHELVFVVEQNRDGQMRTLLINELETNPAKLIPILYFAGLSISADYIDQQISAYYEEHKLARLTEVTS